MRHLAYSLVPAGFFFLTIILWRMEFNPRVFAPVLMALVAILLTGAIGMSLGSWFSRRTEGSTHPLALRLTTLTILAVVLLGPSACRKIAARVSAARAEVAGAAQLRTDVSLLRRTVIVPTLDVPIADGTNVVWCGTMQLAWNELRALAGEEIRMENQDPAVDRLNRATLTKTDLDPDTYVVAAARSGERAARDLRARVGKAFQGTLTPELIPDPASLPPNAALLYAALFVNLPFERAFSRLERPLDFGGTKVAAFGTEGDLGDFKQARKIRSQVSVLDFRDADNFIIELKTKRERHQLILAKVPPAVTLEAALKAVLARLPAQPPDKPQLYKDLIVPIANYDLVRSYTELVGRPLLVKNPLLNKMPVGLAVQSVRFKLDERGAILKSEAVMMLKCAALPEDFPDLIFDKPFLVLLKLAASDKPYFAMWVGNAEILTPFSTKTPSAK
jgi:hypothetical protein